MKPWQEMWRQYQYYVIIGLLSCIALFFFPALGSEAGLGFVFPTTAAGWIVYVLTKLAVAALNIMIFHCFVLQAKLNIKDDDKYKEACRILAEHKTGNAIPQSPETYFHNLYRKKGLTVFFTSLVSAIGLTQAILAYDLVSMLTYLVTIVIGIITGILTMNATEDFWTSEYYEYAIYVKTQKTVAVDKKKSTDAGNDTSCAIG